MFLTRAGVGLGYSRPREMNNYETLGNSSDSKMADAQRREARKRKLLQNSEDRLQRILGSRSSHLTTLKSQHQPSDIVLNSTSAEKDVSNQNKFDVDTKESETIVRGKDVSPLIEDEDNETVQNIKAEETACESKDVVTDGRNYLDEEFKDVPEVTSCHQDLPPSEVNETVEHLPSSSNSGIWTRVIFNIILAIVLVSKWTYVNLEVLLSVNRNQDRGSSQSGLIQSEVRQLLQLRRQTSVSHTQFIFHLGDV